MNDFKKELIDTNVDSETLKQSIISKIQTIDDPSFNVTVSTDEVLKIMVQFKDITETFEIFDVIPESVDITLNKINEFVKGLVK